LRAVHGHAPGQAVTPERLAKPGLDGLALFVWASFREQAKARMIADKREGMAAALLKRKMSLKVYLQLRIRPLVLKGEERYPLFAFRRIDQAAAAQNAGDGRGAGMSAWPKSSKRRFILRPPQAGYLARSSVTASSMAKAVRPGEVFGAAQAVQKTCEDLGEAVCGCAGGSLACGFGGGRDF
jgi:hypothetical protein